jgi:RHS repeat-associated protein
MISRMVISFISMAVLAVASLCHAVSLTTDDVEIPCVKNDISTVFRGCIDVESGNYLSLDVDMKLAGPSQWDVGKAYDAENKDVCMMQGGWYLSIPYKAKQVCGNYQSNGFLIKQEFGSFKHYNTVKRGGGFVVSPKSRSIVNGYSSVLGGTTNVRNNVVVHDGRTPIEMRETFGDGTYNSFSSRVGPKKKAGDLFFLEYQHKCDGTRVWVDYADKDVPSRVWSGDVKKSRRYNEIKIQRSDKSLTLNAPDGQRVEYTFTKDGKHRFITSASYPEKPQERYTYKNHNRRNPHQRDLTRVDRPDNRFSLIEYYDNTSTVPGNKSYKGVRRLWGPIGPTAQPRAMATFYYNDDNTEIYDEYGKQRTVYRFDKKNHHLTAIEQYSCSPAGARPGNLYLKEEYEWGNKEHPGDIEGNLISKVVRDSSGTARSFATYTYDRRGNVLSETIWGNLSGHCSKPLIIEKPLLPKDRCHHSNNGVESYTVRYTYSDDGRNVMTSKTEDNGRSIEYRYDVPGSTLLTAEMVFWKGKLCERIFYSYDADKCLVAVMHDEGGTRNPHTMKDVIRRIVHRITPSKSMASFGKPHIVEKKYYNFDLKREELLSKVVCRYDDRGLLVKKETYDKRNALRYHLSWQYDVRRRPVKEVDSRGTTRLFGYDANNNLTFSQGPNFNVKAHHSYDFANRMVSTKNVYSDGLQQSVTCTYDLRGNKTSSKDAFGNTTSYSYDFLGREVKTVSPPIVSDNLGKFPQTSCPTVTKEYDIFGNVTLLRDPRGNAVKTSYTLRGKPCAVRYPDNSEEKFYYNLDGTLRKKIEKDKSYVVFEYDYRGRVTNKEWHWPAGVLLKREVTTYNAYGVATFTDAMGVKTMYHYDRAGRCIGRDKEYEKERYSYDAMGNKSVVARYYGGGKNDFFNEIKEYDLYGNVVAEKKGYAYGVVTHMMKRVFDAEGNCTEEHRYADGTVGIKRTTFDAHNKPVKIIDETGNTTTMHYDYNARNSIGQRVMKETVVDPYGNSVETICDTHGKPFMVTKMDAARKTLDRHEYRYDVTGNKRHDIHFVYGRGDKPLGIGACWGYDSMNRVIRSVEASGTRQQRVTSYGYNVRGCMTKKVLPSGVTITSGYDIINRLTRHRSSDESFNYAYTYTFLDKIACVKKVGTFCETRRWYDRCGRLTKETQESALQPSYKYDRAGRCIEIRYCDMIVQYKYKGPHLHKIQRVTAGNKVLYEHCYEKFDLSGVPIEETMVGEAGKLKTRWDKHGRCIEYASEPLTWKIPEGGYDKRGNIARCEIQDRCGGYDTSFGYNALQQLVDEKGFVQHSYNYDSRNNRIAKDDNVYGVDFLDQVKTEKGVEYHYDKVGNIVKKVEAGKAFTYTYDANNNLLSVMMPDKGRVTYAYDPFGRRIVKRGAVWDEKTKKYENKSFERFLYFGDNEIAVYDHRNNLPVMMRMVGLGYGQETGATVSIEKGDTVYAVVHDNRGSISALVDAGDGSVVESYRYTAYGEEVLFNAAKEMVETSQCGNPWRYCGKHTDDETGYVWFGKRYYNTILGRWATRDPAGNIDGPNLYSYVWNAPMTYTDMLGLYSEGKGGVLGAFSSVLQSMIGFFRGGRSESDLSKSQDIYLDEYKSGMNNNARGKGSYLQLKNRSSRGRIFRTRAIAKEYEALGKTINYGTVLGMDNTFDEFVESVEYGMDLKGIDATNYVYNATHGKVADIGECILGSCGVVTRPAQLLAQSWKELIPNLKEGELFYHESHSQGGIVSCGALGLVSKDIRKKIRVLSVSPGGHISNKMCAQVEHISNPYDIVTYFDIVGKVMCLSSTTMVTPPKGSSKFAHGFKDPTFAESIVDSYSDHIEKQGSYR